MIIDLSTTAGAALSPDRKHRYLLWRRWSTDHPQSLVLWVMLNPSTADEHTLDPTLRRCRGFSQDWGFTGFVIANLYTYRATSPKELAKAIARGEGNGDRDGNRDGTTLDLLGFPDKDLPLGDAIIRWAADVCQMTVVAWGNHASPQRVAEVAPLLPGAACLRTTRRGAPGHPLYVPRAHPLQLWAPERSERPRPAPGGVSARSDGD